MFKKILFSLFFISLIAQGQHTVIGTINNANDYNYIMLYQLKGINQNYISNVGIKDGKFSFDIPENTPKGMYRLAYDLNKNLFVDFLFNNENIEVEFNALNPSLSIVFIQSKENRTYSNYTLQTNEIRQKLDSIQLAYLKTIDEKELHQLTKNYELIYKKFLENQLNFEKVSDGLLVNNFIKSSYKYYSPTVIKTGQEYLTSEKEHFFENINFEDVELRNSTFISQKVIDYVFYLSQSDDPQVQNALYKSAVLEVMQLLGSNDSLISEISTVLMYSFLQVDNTPIIELILNDVYKKLPQEFIDSSVVSEVEAKIKLALGKTAPNFLWDTMGQNYSLHALNGFENYIVVFWSTSCSHCLNEIPQLYEYVKDNSKIKVIAVALEKDAVDFQKHAANYKNWFNVLGLDKWENSIAKSYDIISTPTYFVLNSKKQIVAKPEFLKDVKLFFGN